MPSIVSYRQKLGDARCAEARKEKKTAMTTWHHDQIFDQRRSAILAIRPRMSDRELAEEMGMEWYAYARAMNRLQSYQ
jgi:hypothetical protein